MEEAELHAALTTRRHSAHDLGRSATSSHSSAGWGNNALTPLQLLNQIGGYGDYLRLFSSSSGPVTSVSSVTSVIPLRPILAHHPTLVYQQMEMYRTRVW